LTGVNDGEIRTAVSIEIGDGKMGRYVGGRGCRG
jgi:hypothetical protein